MIDIRFLGPVQVRVGAARVTVGGPRPISVLIALALTPGDVVSADRLLEEVWGDAPPRSALDTLQSYLSRLRHVLEPGLAAHEHGRMLVREMGGYRLDGAAVDTDARRFVAEVSGGRRVLEAGATRSGIEQLTGALARWRGTVAQGIDLGPGGRAEAARLHELRLSATEELLEARLAIGEHAPVVEELEALVRAHPVRERFHGLRMLALYRSGRQGEALAAYREARQQLVDHLGVEPSPPLARLHEQLLAQDPSLLVGHLRSNGHPAGGRRPTPAVASGGGPGHLPPGPVELVGRTAARQEVAEILRRARLVTLTGAGGCGKTQLALAVAHDVRLEHPDGVWVVELRSLREEELVPDVVAATLGVEVEAGLGTVTDALVRHLEDREALLVLDGCDHLVDVGGSLVRALLDRCARLRVLATGRHPLDVEGEVSWRVPSLEVPRADADLGEIRTAASALLYERRAAAALPGYRIGGQDAGVVRTLCRELDGIPLALELAAALRSDLTRGELTEHLDERFARRRSSERLTPSRQRTLRAAIAWSYDLLDGPARRLLGLLSGFVGGATLEGVEAVCAGDLTVGSAAGPLQTLVDRSLVLAAPTPIGPTRHEVPEPIGAFVRTQLGDGEAAAVAARHATWCAEHATRAASHLHGVEQVRWLHAIHAERHDVRWALRWALTNERVDLAVRIVAGVWWFWLRCGRAREGAGWVTAVLEAVEHAPDPLLQQAHFGAGVLRGALGDLHTATEHLRHSVELARALGDPGAVALALARLAQTLDVAGRRREAGTNLRRARETAVADPWLDANLADVAGHLAWSAGDLPVAEASFRRGEAAYLEAGDRWSACLARLGSATVARRKGDDRAALELHERNLSAFRTLVPRLDLGGPAHDLRGVAVRCSRAGRHAEALELLEASRSVRTMGAAPMAAAARREVEQVPAAAAARLTSTQIADARARGRSASAPAAVDRALEIAASLRTLVPA